MNAVVFEESNIERTNMAEADRIARIELDIAEVKGDVKIVTVRLGELKSEFQDFKIEVAKEFGAVRVEIHKESGSLRAEIGDFRTEVAKEFTEVAKEFGEFRAEVKAGFESLGASLERTKVWMLSTGIVTVLTVAAVVGLKSH